MRVGREFFNFYNHDFVRVAVAIPSLRVADPAYNAEQTIALLRQAAEQQAALVLFPELGISAYSCDDLFHQRALLEACLEALGTILRASAPLPLVGVVGMPIQVDHLLYNCAVVFSGGRVLGVVPKTFLPNYREFYEVRQFTSGDSATHATVNLPGQPDVPFGSSLLFRLADEPLFTFHVEICEDV